VPKVWPPGFVRVPDEEWTRAEVATLAQKYDAVGRHGWYANLDPSVEEMASVLRESDVLVDYSGGTGLFIERLLAAVGSRAIGVVDADSSPKFLALALAKLRDDPRVAFRLIRFLKEEKRLQRLDEALGPELASRGADALVSTNAIHLYHDLDDTLASWARVLRSGAHVHVQSGNIRDADAAKEAWIIDQTVEAVHLAACAIVEAKPRFERYRAPLHIRERMDAHAALRRKFFLPPRPLAHYVSALERTGFVEIAARTQPVEARASEWREFLAVYSEGVLGWVGGTERVEGAAAPPEALADRMELLGLALDEVLGGREEFMASWTYISCRRP